MSLYQPQINLDAEMGLVLSYLKLIIMFISSSSFYKAMPVSVSCLCEPFFPDILEDLPVFFFSEI
jgi:hypothetical protein